MVLLVALGVLYALNHSAAGSYLAQLVGRKP